MFDFLRNDKLQKYHPRFHNKTPLKQNQFGVVVGGPVYLPKLYDGRNRTFFFASYQGGRRVTGKLRPRPGTDRRGKGGRLQRMAHTAFRSAQRRTDAGSGVCPLQRPPFPDNRIPAARFAPQSTALIKYWPEPNQALCLAVQQLHASTNTPVHMDQYTVRADHNFSVKDRCSGSF